MSNEKYLEVLEKLRLIDDVLFSACFDDNPEDVQYILRIILDKPDLNVLKVQTQKSVENLYGRSVRFDVFASDSNGKLYNIEVQRADSGAIPARARYNSAMLDFHELQKSRDFKELPESFVIFITENDVLGYGLPLNTIDSTIKENGKPFKSGSHTVYVNCEHHDAETALGKLVHDFLCRDSRDKYYYDVIAERIRYLKEDQEGVREMGGVVEELLKERDKEHEAALKAQQKSLQKSFAEKLIESGKLALQEIAAYSGLSLATVKRLAKKLEPSLS